MVCRFSDICQNFCIFNGKKKTLLVRLHYKSVLKSNNAKKKKKIGSFVHPYHTSQDASHPLNGKHLSQKNTHTKTIKTFALV